MDQFLGPFIRNTPSSSTFRTENSILSNRQPSFSLQHIKIDRLEPDFSIRSYSPKKVEAFLESIRKHQFQFEQLVLKICPAKNKANAFEVFSGSHRLMAIKEFNLNSDETLQCQLYPSHLSYSERVAILVDNEYFSLADRVEIIRRLVREENNENVQILYDRLFSDFKYKIEGQYQSTFSSLIFLPDHHWKVLKEVMQTFQDGIISQYDKQSRSDKKKSEICISFFVDVFDAYNLKPDLTIGVFKTLIEKKTSLLWALERLKTLGLTLKETFEDLDIINYELEDPPDIRKASMFFAGRLMTEFELCQILRNSRTISSLNNETSRPAELVANVLKPQLGNSIEFSVAPILVDNLKPLKDCSILLHEFYDFELILGRIEGRIIIAFMGNEVYLERVRQRLGDSHIKVETRTRDLQPIARPLRFPAKLNSDVYIYYFETKMNELIPNRDCLMHMIWDRKVPLATFMHLPELSNILRLISPLELIAINFSSSHARLIFETAINIETIKTLKIATNTIDQASELSNSIQQLYFPKERLSEENLIQNDIPEQEISTDTNSIEFLQQSVCQDFVIRCSPPHLPEISTKSRKPVRKRPNILAPIKPKIKPACDDNIIVLEDYEIQEYCDKCGLINSFSSSGDCRHCGGKGFSRNRDLSTFITPDPNVLQKNIGTLNDITDKLRLCVGCEQFRVLRRDQFCRKCSKLHPKRKSASEIKKCPECQKLKNGKKFIREKCSTCYQREMRKNRKERQGALNESIAVVNEFLNTYDTSLGQNDSEPELNRIKTELDEEQPNLSTNELLMKL